MSTAAARATGGDDLAAVGGSSGGNVERPRSKLEPRDASPERPSSRDSSSPDNTCAICLGKPENKSFTDSCFHTFCFGCLAEWAKLKPECPLCKQRFKSIIHSVRSLEDYDQYFLSEEQHRTRSLYSTSFSGDGPDGRRFRFPTTLTAERRQQLAMERSLQSSNQRATSASRVPRAGMMQNEAVGRYNLTTTSAERRYLYDLDLWVSNNPTRYREASPQFYRDNPACVHRLIPWLNRELIALLGGSSSRITAVLELVLSLISEVDIRHPDFSRHLYPSFGSRTQHFVHEFYAFATSVHDMVNYDRNTLYGSAISVLARGTPVERYQSQLAESQRRAAELVSNAAPRESSPRPGPSGVVSRQAREVVAAPVADDSDSDSSDCIVVSVVKPGERTPVVISLLSSSSDDEDTSIQNLLHEETVVSEERATGLIEESVFEVYPPPASPREPSPSTPRAMPPRTRAVSFVSADSWTSDSDSRSSTSSSSHRRAARKKKVEVRPPKLRSVVGSVVHRSASSSSPRRRHEHKKSKKSKKHKRRESRSRRE
uniref:E3 ubiquitin-protein ligase Topors n=1 Tax=Ixodes ricinus TaxID=34613 RepID=A0A131Y9F6_IXORI